MGKTLNTLASHAFSGGWGLH